jgi:hypothetical protein
VLICDSQHITIKYFFPDSHNNVLHFFYLNAECHYADRRYAECRGVTVTNSAEVTDKANGKESTVNRALGGSTYPG